LYQKDGSLSEVSNRARLGFDNFQRNEKVLAPRTIQLFMEFADKNREGQQQMLYLPEGEDDTMNMLFNVVKALNSNRELMEFVLPTIDAILTYEPAILNKQANKIIAAKDTSLFSPAKSILAVAGHQPATYEASARIVAILLG
jgi:hypothetical protein